MFKGMNVLTVILTAIVLVALRFAWYDHFAGVAWAALPMRLVADVRADPLITAAALVNAALLAGGLVWLVAQTGERSLVGGVLGGLAAFVLFGLTTLLQPYIYGGRVGAGGLPSDLLVEGGYLLAAFLVGGLMVGLLARRRRPRASADRAAMFAGGH